MWEDNGEGVAALYYTAGEAGGWFGVSLQVEAGAGPAAGDADREGRNIYGEGGQ